MFKSVAFAGLLAASFAATAAPSTWTFTYTGFYEDYVGFLGDRELSGTFSGYDADSNGTIDKAEISSLIIAGVDYMTCGAGGSPYFSCGTEAFSYQLGGKLHFVAGITSSDPEGYRGGAHFYQTGKSEWEYRYTGSSESRKDYYWTDDTRFSITDGTAANPLPAVPEPGTWAMLAAGLLVVSGATLRRPRNR